MDSSRSHDRILPNSIDLTGACTLLVCACVPSTFKCFYKIVIHCYPLYSGNSNTNKRQKKKLQACMFNTRTPSKHFLCFRKSYVVGESLCFNFENIHFSVYENIWTNFVHTYSVWQTNRTLGVLYRK